MSQHQIEHLLDRFRYSADRTYRVAHFVVLALGLAAMIAVTEPNLGGEWRTWLMVGLWFCLAFFACELVIKCWPGPRSEGSVRYLFSVGGVIDLLAVLPIPIALIIGVPADTAWLLASLWLLKLTAIVPGFSLLARVIAMEARPLASVLVIFLIVLLLGGTALHVLERTQQPTNFGSLPASLWWAVTTLTTTGYGDSVPQTFLGRLVAGIVMICGLGVFGLWTGILANGFAAEHRRLNFIQNWDLVRRVPFLRNLDPPAVIALTRMLRRVDLAERTVVVRQGRPGDCMYFVASGEVEVKLEPQPVRLGPGSFFGEIALLKDTMRTATVMTTAASTLLILEVADFRDFMAHHPELAAAIEQEATRRAAAIKGGTPEKHDMAQNSDDND
jgi:voltage-gated potassium channel